MSRTWFTADLHLGHANIIRFCQRPFLSPEEMALHQNNPKGNLRISAATLARHDEILLASINESVQEHDTLWILGDFCWGGIEAAKKYRSRILCKNVHLVWGNHDPLGIAECFQRVHDQILITVQGQDIFLNHYPMRSWHRSFHGAWHLYGHVHGRLSQEDQAQPWLLVKDVGIDNCQYRPISFEEIQGYMKPRIEAFKKRRAAFLSGDTSVTLT
ncbi:MAG: metallophosphoesterase [Gemmataceae bacterium]|jgi:calcineurin-like phosphoesterase family protein|nr:metallophosphoesterase [Gemmataceae bacterium]